MIEIQDIEIDDKNWRVTAEQSGAVTNHLLLDAINDIAREIQNKAQEFAPIGKGFNPKDVPGTLKREGIIREDARISDVGDGGVAGAFLDPTSAAFGGGFSVRGGNPRNRGQFSRRPAGHEALSPGHVFTGGIPGGRVVTALVTLNPLVPHARWVHQGTGIYGPHHSPIVPRVAPYLTFRWHGRRFEKKSVRGQQPQPFLSEAYVYVNNIYAPAKLTELRAELSAEL